MNHDRCDYAACTAPAIHSDGPWDFCAVHWPQHQAERDGRDLELPRHQREQLQAAVTHALRPGHGTLSRARQHYRQGEPLCQACKTAELVHANPTGADRRTSRARWVA